MLNVPLKADLGKDVMNAQLIKKQIQLTVLNVKKDLFF